VKWDIFIDKISKTYGCADHYVKYNIIIVVDKWQSLESPLRFYIVVNNPKLSHIEIQWLIILYLNFFNGIRSNFEC